MIKKKKKLKTLMEFQVSVREGFVLLLPALLGQQGVVFHLGRPPGPHWASPASLPMAY